MNVVYITLLAAFFTQMGYFLWKVAANSLVKIESKQTSYIIKKYLLNWKWQLGMLSTICGWLFFVKATSIGEISLIEPLMSAGDLLLILVAVIFLQERLSKIEWFGLALTTLGAGILSIGAKDVTTVNIDWTYLYFFITLSIISAAALFLIAKKSARIEILLALIVGIGFGIGAILTELMTAYLSQHGQSLDSLFFIFNPIFPFMMTANILSLLLIQIAFQKGRAAVIVPVQLSVASAISVIGGSIVFSEAIPASRIISIIMILIGAVFLQNKN